MNRKTLKIVKAETEAIEESLSIAIEDIAFKEKNIQYHNSQNNNNQRNDTIPKNNDLIAEAYRLTGRVEGFTVSSRFADMSALFLLKQIKENKIYKEIKGAETWEKYCISIGYTRSKIDEDLSNLETFGEQFLLTIGNLGIGYKELRKLKSSTKSGTFEILDDAISIDGEIVNLADTDKLKEALITVIEAKDEIIKEKERVIIAKEELNRELSKGREDARIESEEYKRKINNYTTGKEFNIDECELPAFKELKSIEDRITSIFFDMNKLTDIDLSERNQHIFGGCLVLSFKLLDDIRVKLNNSGVYLDRLYMDDNEIEKSDRMLLPRDFRKHNIDEK